VFVFLPLSTQTTHSNAHDTTHNQKPKKHKIKKGTILGGNHGGFQHTIRVPADFAFAIPAELESSAAAPLLCAGITVYAPLRAHLRGPGTRVAVLGVGGLGHLAVQVRELFCLAFVCVCP
jgi:D-arabinose 1-dehydrogenase-like Zn-dependent alcohol dehydrogenase